MNTKNILITGARAPVALELARQFAKEGHNIFCADSIRHPICRYSNDIAHSFRVSPPNQNPEKFVSDLINICILKQIDLLIPTCEEVFFISKYKDKFAGICEVFVDDFALLKKLHSKWEFIKLVESAGMPAPKSWLIQNAKDLENVDVCPFILKPVFSRFGSQVKIVETNYIGSIEKPWVAQQFLPGKLWCTYSVAKQGKLILHTNYPSSFKAGQGASIFFKHYQNEAIENWVRQFLEKIKFTGQIAFDFIECEGKYLPIECNPRSTSGIHLFSQIADRFLNPSEKCLQPNTDATAILKLPMFIYGLTSIRSFKDLKEWLHAMKSKDVIFRANNFIPAFHQFFSFFEFWIKGIKNKRSAIEASTLDIEFNGEL